VFCNSNEDEEVSKEEQINKGSRFWTTILDYSLFLKILINFSQHLGD